MFYSVKDILSDLIRRPGSGGEYELALAAIRKRLDETKTIHRCSCGLGYNRDQWSRAPFVGVGLGLEMRNCACGSTMSIEIGDGHNELKVRL